VKNSNLIKIHSDENDLSEEQKLFNQLSKQIEKKKKELDKWEKYAEEYRQKHTKYFFPLENEFYECRKSMVFLFDMRLEDTNFNNGEKRKLRALTHDMCIDLLSENYDEKVEIILKKYSKPRPKKKSILEDIFENIASKMEENIGRWQEEMANEDEEYRESEQETKEEKEGRESMKDIYRKLAAILHPDRELDEKEKKRKTEVLQRVTAAYRDRNLTELLKIELEETKSMMSADKLSKETTKGLNKVLRNELEELREKVYLSKRYFQISFNGLRLSNLSKKKIDNLFNEKVEHKNKIIKSAKTDIENFTSNVKNLKKFIRSLEIRRRPSLEDLIFM
jgi:hypothetical protein